MLENQDRIIFNDGQVADNLAIRNLTLGVTTKLSILVEIAIKKLKTPLAFQ